MTPGIPEAGSVLIHAPFGRDALLAKQTLEEAGIRAEICETFTQFCGRIGQGADMALVVQEALIGPSLQLLSDTLSRQPRWSDFPLIVLAQGGASVDAPWLSLGELGSIGHAIMLERPVRVETLVSAVRVALRSRRRQYELARNLAELQEAERRIRQAHAQAERANMSKTVFLASASHDLRQPFQAMRLYQQLLEQMIHEEGPRKVLTLLGQSMDSGEELLNALLDVSTLEAGNVRPAQERVIVSELIASVIGDLAPLAEAKGLVLRGRPCLHVVRSDPVMLKRLVRNLVVNAVRYTNKGGVLIGCRLQDGGALRIEVWDTGIGIADDMLDLIFEDFVQLGNDERDRSKGMGLGLAIVTRMARLLGHKITVKSRPGRGSVFAVTVPLAGESEGTG
jgi:signal transduction histidine kinase